jgi:Bifunctional DNA primase/polymerase, N-terminal/AAA domain
VPCFSSRVVVRMPDDSGRPTGEQSGHLEINQDQGSTLLDAALAYAELGYPVFPLRPNGKLPVLPSAHADKQEQRECKGRCGHDGHGFYDATTDPTKIKAWWTARPTANIGIRTGAGSGLIVLDVDDGEDGDKALAELEAEHGPIPPTLTARTPGDQAKGKRPGRQLYLRHFGEHVKLSAGQLGDHLDVRADGGYVAAPPSVRPDGPYRFEDPWQECAEVPERWRGVLQNRPQEAQEPPSGQVWDLFDKADTWTRDKAEQHVEEYALAPLRAAQDGTINTTLNTSAVILGHFVPAIWSEAEAQAKLLKALESTVYDGATWKAEDTIASGLSAGMAEPYDVTEDQAPPEDKPEPSRFEAEVAKEQLRLWIREEAQRRHREMTAEQLPEPTLTRLSDLLAEPLTAPAYRVNKLWTKGGNVILAAQRKAGKTTLVENLTRSLVDNQTFLDRGDQFASAGHDDYDVTPVDGLVALLDLELDRNMLHRWLADQKIRNTDRLLVESMRGQAHLFDIRDDKRRQKWASLFSHYGVKVLILDPLGAMLDAYGLDENSNSDVGPVLQALDALKVDAGIEELLLVHHFGHNGERSRGASKLRGWPDVEWFLVRERAKNGEEPPPDAERFFLAEGRDVMVPETRVEFDPATRRLWLAGGSRVQRKATKDAPALLAIVTENPGLSQTAIEAEAQARDIARDRARAALKALIKSGQVVTKPGPKRATLHFPADE